MIPARLRVSASGRGVLSVGPLDDRLSEPVRAEHLDGPPPVLTQPGSAEGVPDESGRYGTGRNPELCSLRVGHALHGT